MYVYKRTEPGVWTVGYYDKDGNWHPESDWSNPNDAAMRAAFLNGAHVEHEEENSKHIDRSNGNEYVIYCPLEPEKHGPFSHIKVPINWQEARVGYKTEETIVELFDKLMTCMPYTAIINASIEADGDLAKIVQKLLKLIYGPSYIFSILRRS